MILDPAKYRGVRTGPKLKPKGRVNEQSFKVNFGNNKEKKNMREKNPKTHKLVKVQTRDQ